MPNSRDPNAAKNALRDLLQFFRREPDMLYRVGPISLWLRGGYSVDRVEAMMEELVDQGILRPATKQELWQHGSYTHGYLLTPEGLATLPPEDRSYGVI